jgi:hypothetical protein
MPMTRPAAFVFAFLAISLPIGAAGQVPDDSPVVEAGVEVSAGPHGDGEWSSVGGRVALNLDSRTALEGAFSPERVRDDFSHVDYLTVQLRRTLHRFGNGSLFGALGGAIATRYLDSRYYGEFYSPVESVSRTVGVSFAFGGTVEVAPYLAVRGETQYVLGENSLLRFGGGVTVPVGGRYPGRGVTIDAPGLAGTPGASIRGGQTVWITTSAGREYAGEVASRSPDAVTLRHPGGATTITTSDITLIEKPDTLLNGTLIGMVSAGAGGALLGGVLGDLVCEGSSGCVFIGALLVGGMGAGGGGLVGAMVDAFRDGRQVIYRRTPPSRGARLSLTPAVSRAGASLGGVLRW